MAITRLESKEREAQVSELPLKRDLVGGLEKGLQVIEAFDQERSRLTIAEVAQRAGLTRAAARRYLLTLAHLGYIRHEQKLFSLTPKVLRLGQSYLHSARLPRIVQPMLYRLAYSLEEAASVGVLDHDEIVCVAAVSAGRIISATLQPGTRVPAFWTANGRVLLASRPEGEVGALLSQVKPESITTYTLVNKDRLLMEIARTRTQGYAIVDQELELGLRTIAVPIKSYRGETLAAMNISVHAARVPMEAIVDRCLTPLLKVQVELASLL